MPNHHVKTGLTGYGPDLEPEDEPYDDVAALCAAIVWHINDNVDYLAENWSMAKANGDAEEYMATRELADELSIVAAGFDYESRAKAPLYVDNRDLLDETMMALVEKHFPLTVDVAGNHRLYVWEVSE